MHRLLIDQTLDTLIPKQTSLLHEAAHYSLEGGKRLRPLLLLAVLETYGIPIEKGLHPACALEMIHTYSLIHDDLPCMDNDDYRREKPTLHKAYPEGHALLVGDFLLTLAFETMSQSPELTDKQTLALVQTLSVRSGSEGMIGGQLLDIQGSVDFESIYHKKTGALITAALECGGIVARAPLAPLQALGAFLGLAYQLVDDLIDRDGIVEKIGPAKTEEKIAKLDAKIEEILSTFPNGGACLSAICSKMIHRTV